VASLERTAYPQFSRCYSPKDLEHTFTPDEDEVAWIKANGRSASSRLGLAVLLKSFQLLWYFPAIDTIPPEIVNHVRLTLGFGESVPVEYPVKMTFYRHLEAIRSF